VDRRAGKYRGLDNGEWLSSRHSFWPQHAAGFLIVVRICRRRHSNRLASRNSEAKRPDPGFSARNPVHGPNRDLRGFAPALTSNFVLHFGKRSLKRATASHASHSLHNRGPLPLLARRSRYPGCAGCHGQWRGTEADSRRQVIRNDSGDGADSYPLCRLPDSRYARGHPRSIQF
jgi:hypothetical protein